MLSGNIELSLINIFFLNAQIYLNLEINNVQTFHYFCKFKLSNNNVEKKKQCNVCRFFIIKVGKFPLIFSNSIYISLS